ncbi:MAG: SRPBCC family protein [Burkholderiales bacterium]
MPATHFDLVSHWRIPAPIDRVWEALVDVEHWVLWWPYVRKVQPLRSGGSNGLGCQWRIEWATRLPYRLLIDVETIDVQKPERLRGHSTGQLQGEGIWLLRHEGGITDITYVYRVELAASWMRWLAPLLAPLFRWNHEGVMRAGGLGLAQHLARAQNPSR